MTLPNNPPTLPRRDPGDDCYLDPDDDCFPVDLDGVQRIAGRSDLGVGLWKQEREREEALANAIGWASRP